MSTNAYKYLFPSEVMGNTAVIDHKEFHDIEVYSIDSGHKNCDSKTSVSPICLVVKAEQPSGAPLPAFPCTPEAISEVCAFETGNKHE